MSMTINPAHAYCERQKHFVSLEQTEGHCREKHSCSDDACPLEKEFGQPRFGRALQLLAASFGQALGPHKD